MTSQCMILTKRFSLLASDRQETMADGKTYEGIGKIFELSSCHSAGVMVNGRVDFADVPIEILIGEFKAKTDFKKIETVDEIKNRLISFLAQSTEPISAEEYLEEMLKTFREDFSSEIEENGFEAAIDSKSRKDIFPFICRYSSFEEEFLDMIPEGFDEKEYNRIIWEIFSSEMAWGATGIVIVGFNVKSHYPSFSQLDIYFNNDGEIVCEEVGSAVDSKKPIVKVFAINEEAYTFITGVNEEFIEYILAYIDDANESVLSNIKWNLEKENMENIEGILEIIKNAQDMEFRDLCKNVDNYRSDAIDYTSNSIEYLPPWLLCIFAELLIRLTAVKQKTTSEIESVSISTDILLLEKTKGFKWQNNKV